MPLSQLLAAARAQRADFLELLKAFVETESPSSDKAAGDRMADLLASTFAADGWQVERLPKDGVSDLLQLRWPGLPSGDGSLVLAHYDTVWPLGTLGQMPWRFDEAADRAYGPGAYDMKGGIVQTLLAVRLLRQLDMLPQGEITLLITPDEEVGSNASRALIESEAKRHARVYVVEPPRADGALKVGRKGVADYSLSFTGVPAHAGNQPELGASALVELAHATLFARGLEDSEVGTTINPTVARAGSARNVITEHAELDMDARVLRLDEAERLDGALRGYQPRDPRVKVALRGGLNRPPMEPTPGNLGLFDEARQVGAAWGWDLQSAIVGGGSDGNFTSVLGVPTLDGLGAVGDGAHARHEHVEVGPTLERTALLAALLGGSIRAASGGSNRP